MKNQHILIGLTFLALSSGLNAQTIKNIHRQNLPVLQIPVELIDKVQTLEVNGVKHLQITPLFGEITQIPISEIDSITHYLGFVNPEQLGVMRTASVMGIVRGPTGAAEMNAIVRSPYGGEETRTDVNGVFFLNNITVYDKLGYITIEKPGFHKGSRSFLPLETGSNRVNVQLLTMTQSGTFVAAAGGSVTSGLLQLTFPTNAIQLNGQPYTGTVRVFARALDPTSSAMFDQMPGDLLGGLNDSLSLLRSFGMASIELRDANMNELQLADGASATLTFNIPTALQADAPQTIDWWSFDEALGYWKHEGEAQKTGTQYVGAASHFSWWNCDVPQNFNDFNGTINSTDGNPITDAQVNVVTPTMGTGITYTNAEGVFSGRVPKNQTLTLNINLTCSTTNDWALAYSESILSEEIAIEGTYTASLSGYYPIIGTVVTCQNVPIESGYVKMGSQIFFANQGGFTIQTCTTGEYEIRGYDNSNPDSVKCSVLNIVQVGAQGANTGTIQACILVFGVISDIDGNVYPVLLIGSKFWMTENLRTTRFQNGSLIPNVTSNSSWAQLTTPAWCNFDNNTGNNLLYGKLYNGYSTFLANNVCPAGWRVPTDAEWTNLIEYLGGESVAGGKMKALTSWDSPNLDATNESGFTGLSGGIRSDNEGAFFGEGELAYWWSRTANVNDSESSWGRIVYHYMGYVDRNYYDRQHGISIRCVKD